MAARGTTGRPRRPQSVDDLMAANSEFFGNRDAKAVLKHGLLARYAYYFAIRAGKAARKNVLLIDGYAGEGRYEDGNPGSPLLLASQGERAKTQGLDVQLVFIEQDEARRTRLEATLADEGVQGSEILAGDLDGEIDSVLQRHPQRAVLLFVDPFGLAISLETLERTLKRRVGGQPIDVIYHFSLSTVCRMGALGVTNKYGAASAAGQLDVALGPGTWRQPFEASDGSDGAATRAALAAAANFTSGIAARTSMRSTSIEVRSRPGQLPKYLLTLFSADAKAHWDFADMAGRTYVEWLHHCDLEDFNANLRADEAVGIYSLFGEAEAPEVEKIDEMLRREAETYLAENIRGMFDTHQSILPNDHIPALYGEMLGRARAKHLKKAFQHLHAEGVVDDDASGDGWFKRTIKRRAV